MKKLVAVLGVLSLVACAGVQAKLADAKSKASDAYPKVECRAKVIDPYVDFILAADLPAILDGLQSFEGALEAAGVLKEEVANVKQAFANCGKL
jgi:hypothetical protein